jgi:GH15 family glucan-1,4-alpha-glucosidase
MADRIEDYALIGDCETAALVSRTGSIDWLCWPRFDSGACFAALLGTHQNGRWLLAPVDANARVSRRYRGDTLILETDYETNDGAVRVIDFMPLRDHRSNVVRTVVGLRGRVAMHTQIIFRFEYGSVVPWVSRLDDGSLRAIAGPDMVVVTSDIELRGKDLTTVGEFTVGEGDRASFVMTWGPSHQPPPRTGDPNTALRSTEQFWTHWAEVCKYRGEWREPVMRSLLTLKALTYAPTGGIVAAPTTSLPEQIGGVRSPFSPSWMPAISARPKLGATGCCAPRREAPTRRRSCTASPASERCANGSCRGSPVMRILNPFDSAMPRTNRCSSTSTAR